jgi:two-component sensor histidine kinase
MGALYRQLDGSAEGTADAAAYLRGLVQAFAAARGPEVAVEARVASPLALPARAAAPLGLLVNELMSEAAARAGGAPVRLRVALAREGWGALRLLVEDDAPPAEGGPSPLAGAFAAELGGAVEVEAGAGGTRATLAFRA